MKKIFFVLFVVFLLSVSLLNAQEKGKVAPKETLTKTAAKPSLDLWVIVPSDCRTCQLGPVVDSLKSFFPDIQPQLISSAEPSTVEMIKQFKITMLPAYLFSKSLDKEANFEKFQQAVEPIADKYYMKPSLSGVSYFLNRPFKAGRLDLFVFISAKESLPILKMVEGIVEQKQSSKKFTLHLIGRENPQKKGEFLSPMGNREVEEGKLFACIDAYAPKAAGQYLTCRMADSNSLFWEDCFQSKSASKDKIKACVKGEEGKRLYLEKIKMSQEWQILYGPLFALNNVEIFGVTSQSTINDVLNAIGQ